MSEGKMQIHIIHSVKGGSGKTAVSLFKALTLAQKVEESQARVLYLDADFTGTALKAMIYGESEEAFQWINTVTLETFEDDIVLSAQTTIGDGLSAFTYGKAYQRETLNSYLLKKVNSIDDILVNGGIYQKSDSDDADMAKDMVNFQIELEGRVDFIFSSHTAADKQEFHCVGEAEDYPPLVLGQFKNRMTRLIKQIYNYNPEGGKSGEKRGIYDYLIIDMPPGEDDYSRALLKCLQKFKKENEV